MIFKKIFFIFNIVTQFFIVYNFIEESENIARFKMAFQATTLRETNLAKFAVDNNFNDATFAADQNVKGWWAVDLNGFYRITEICFLNMYSPGKKHFLFFFSFLFSIKQYV